MIPTVNAHVGSGFDQFERLAERQSLLADHWTRGGGGVPASLMDLGGLALLRTARSRGLQPAIAESAYLPGEMLIC